MRAAKDCEQHAEERFERFFRSIPRGDQSQKLYRWGLAAYLEAYLGGVLDGRQEASNEQDQK